MVLVEHQLLQTQPSLGRKLQELRARIMALGEPLLTAEDIEQEVAEQRDRLKEFEPLEFEPLVR